MFSRCSNLQADVCEPIGTPDGYDLNQALTVAKKNLAITNTGTVLNGTLMILALLLVGGMTLIGAAGVISSLAAGAIGTALISGVVAFAAGGNLYMFSKRIPGDIAEAKTTIQDSKALKNGLASQSSHTITVSDLNKIEGYLNKILTQ